MNARGAMEIILATIGLSVGVLTQNMDSIIVLTAIVTSLMAPPLLRWTLGHVEMGDEERERLDAEERQKGSFVGNLKRVLVPLTGGASSRLAARLVGLVVADQDVEVTAMHVRDVSQDGEGSEEEVEAELGRIESHLNLPKSHLRRVLRDEDGALGPVVPTEAEKGYDLLVIGTTGQGTGAAGPTFTQVSDDLIQEAPCPVLIVRTLSQVGVPTGDGDLAEGSESMALHRVLLPVSGADSDRYAAEIAFALARDRDMVVDVVHVVRGGERRARLSDDEAVRNSGEVGEDLVGRIADLGHALGASVHTDVVVADHDEEAIVERAASNVDLIVMASSQSPVSQRAFLGHLVDYVVRHASCPVVVVGMP